MQTLKEKKILHKKVDYFLVITRDFNNAFCVTNISQSIKYQKYFYDSNKVIFCFFYCYYFSRPSTPSYNLLEHKSQDTWLEETGQNYLSLRERGQELKKSPSRTYSETCASRLRRYSPRSIRPLNSLKFRKK